nr:NdhC [Santalum ellipticum]
MSFDVLGASVFLSVFIEAFRSFHILIVGAIYAW